MKGNHPVTVLCFPSLPVKTPFFASHSRHVDMSGSRSHTMRRFHAAHTVSPARMSPSTYGWSADDAYCIAHTSNAFSSLTVWST